MSDGDYDGGSFAADIFGYLCGYAHLTKLPQSILKKPSRHPCQIATCAIRARSGHHYTDKFTLFEAMVAGEFHELLKERNIPL
jgi:hypothetical protein